MKTMAVVFALLLLLARPAGAILTILANGQTVLPGSELCLNRGDQIVIEITGDGSTPEPLEGFLFVEGPGSISGCTLTYPGTASEYKDLEEVAEAMEITVEETLAIFSAYAERSLTDLSKWVLANNGPLREPLEGLLIGDIVFRCEGGGDALLTLETDDEWTTYPDYTITIHQTAQTRTYYVDVNSGSDDNTGLSPGDAFATIQKAVDSAYDGETIIVQPGLYPGDINFLGKNIIVQSTDPNDYAIVQQTVIGSDSGAGELEAVITFRGAEGPACTLRGFNINGYIRGCDPSVDPGVQSHTHAAISNCILCNNAGDYGTVIIWCDGLISNCILADNNNHPILGGHPTISQCYGTVKNCTLANNTSGIGIGISDAGTTEITNCILYNDAVAIYTGGAANISYSNIAEVVCEDPCQADLAWGPGNTNVDPCFARVGDYAHGIVGDYHLKSQAGRWDPQSSAWLADAGTSPCIDAGSPGSPLGNETGNPRNKRINMGAYGGTAQASKTPANWSLLADLTNDGIVDQRDYAIQAKDNCDPGGEKPGDLNRDGAVDMDDVATLIDAWLQTTIWH
ncbi:MAG: hypothetical protein JXN61_06240 [Sedimentisphaerales bacterium]|nr:hypothetical protein [Sedimentisphaerales bacterium]